VPPASSRIDPRSWGSPADCCWAATKSRRGDLLDRHRREAAALVGGVAVITAALAVALLASREQIGATRRRSVSTQ
jgi:hypothetical protein